MTTLLDAPEFAAAKDALSMTLERAEQARRGRLKFLQDALNRTEDELERVKKQALELPIDIARYRAEIARLEATTGGDILREAMQSQPLSEVVEVQSPKPHACPRCDEGMREVELTRNIFGVPYTYRFTHPDVPPRSEWCDGSGKGGAE